MQQVTSIHSVQPQYVNVQLGKSKMNLLALNFCVPLDKGIVSNLSYQRIKVVRYIENEEYFQAVESVSEDKTVESEDFQALKRTLLKKRLRPL